MVLSVSPFGFLKGYSTLTFMAAVLAAIKNLLNFGMITTERIFSGLMASFTMRLLNIHSIVPSATPS